MTLSNLPGYFSHSLVTRADFLALGITAHNFGRLVERGDVVRFRRGSYCLSHLDSHFLVAARIGGKVTGPTLFGRLGAWQLPDRATIHISVPRHTHLTKVPRGVRLHWSGTPGRSLAEEKDTAIAHVAALRSTRDSVAVLDSIMHKGIMSRSQVLAALHATRRGRYLAPMLDATAESGVESMFRLWLLNHQIRFRSQVRIGNYRVDFLVGKTLVVEIVGEEFHAPRDMFEADASREAYLQSLGYRVLRLSARQVLSRMDEVEAAVLGLIRSKRHNRGPAPAPTAPTRLTSSRARGAALPFWSP